MSDGRFAPSPTGDLHLGNLRTALLAWLSARASGSRFLLRMEDLDLSSVRGSFYERQADDLRALGLDWDGAIKRQSDRRDLYRDAIDTLVRLGVTYPCYCSRRDIREAAAAPHGDSPDRAYPGTCRELSVAQRLAREAEGRPPALRVRADGVRRAFVDRVCGPVEGLVDDVVIRRNDGTPAYNLSVIVDDVEQGIGEVVRGDDLLSSTPRQLHLAALLGLAPPTFAHVPLVLAPSGDRLAKRDGAVTLAERLARGDAVGDVLTMLVASVPAIGAAEPVEPGDLPALAQGFDLARVGREPWVIDPALLATT
jgi:glutamyl-tRNA synthetase